MTSQKTSTKMAIGLALAGFTMLVSTPASATCTQDAYMGSICITAATYCPDQYVEPQGQLLPITNYAALYALMGTAYGGDGQTNFGLPDLRGRTPVGLGTGSGLTPVYPGARGNERQQLSVQQLPAHNHSFNNVTTGIPATTTPGNQVTPDQNLVLGAQERGGTMIYSDQAANTSIEGPAISGSTDSTGTGQTFNTIPPQQGLRYCLAVEGLFPPRP